MAADDEVQVDVTCAITFGGYGGIVLAVAVFTLLKYFYVKRKERKDEEKFLRTEQIKTNKNKKIKKKNSQNTIFSEQKQWLKPKKSY